MKLEIRDLGSISIAVNFTFLSLNLTEEAAHA